MIIKESTKTIEVVYGKYTCEVCGKEFNSKENCIYHEKQCKCNHDNFLFEFESDEDGHICVLEKKCTKCYKLIGLKDCRSYNLEEHQDILGKLWEKLK